jgi:hypothetical protein
MCRANADFANSERVIELGEWKTCRHKVHDGTTVTRFEVSVIPLPLLMSSYCCRLSVAGDVQLRS